MITPNHKDVPEVERIDQWPLSFKNCLLIAIIILLVWFSYQKQKSKTESYVASLASEKKTRITLVELRKHPGLENISAADGEHIIDSLQQVSVLYYELYKKQLNGKTKFT